MNPAEVAVILNIVSDGLTLAETASVSKNQAFALIEKAKKDGRPISESDLNELYSMADADVTKAESGQ